MSDSDKAKRALVCGVGINDASYSVHVYDRSHGNRKIIWRCPYYRTWKDMLKRCYSDQCHSDHPAYVGCEVDPTWHRFSTFKEWMESQSWEGKHLDKDILILGNNIYSQDTCVFVSEQLNKFLSGHGSRLGTYPTGTYWSKRRGNFEAKCNNPFTGKCEYLGAFSSRIDAHQAWRQRKHEFACMYAETVDDPRVAAALRTRYAHTQASALERQSVEGGSK